MKTHSSKAKDQRRYWEAYGFREDPFALNPDPIFLCPTPTHSEALSCMLSGIRDRRGVIVITGEAGVGKTMLVYALLRDQGEKSRAAFVFNPALDLKGVLVNILRDLGSPVLENQGSLFSLLAGFRKFLMERAKQKEVLAVVIDEAQSMEEEVLEGLFRLATPDSPDTNSLQILLVGHPVLEEKLRAGRFNPYRGRITVRKRIRSLSRGESRDYINYRLSLAGGNTDRIFAPDAVDRILEFSRGNPRVLNLVCGRALLIGAGNSVPKVDSKDAKQAIKELRHLACGSPKPYPGSFSSAGSPYSKITRVLLLALSAGIFLISLGKIFSLLLSD